MNDLIENVRKWLRFEIICRASLVFWLTACFGSIFLGQLSKTLRLMMGASFSDQDLWAIMLWSSVGALASFIILVCLISLSACVSKYNDVLANTYISYRPKHNHAHNNSGLTRKSWLRRKEQVQRRDEAICQYCGAHAPNGHVDHIIPLSKGGTDDLSNLAWSCQECNQQKGSKLPSEWLQQQETER